MTTAPYRVHKLIQDLNRDPHLAKTYAADPEAQFKQYGLSESERAGLRDGTPKALMAIGVHPNLQMKFLKLKVGPPKAAGPGGAGPLAFYLRDLGLSS